MEGMKLEDKEEWFKAFVVIQHKGQNNIMAERIRAET